jgi:hypothetical protein
LKRYGFLINIEIVCYSLRDKNLKITICLFYAKNIILTKKARFVSAFFYEKKRKEYYEPPQHVLLVLLFVEFVDDEPALIV